jgi:hypothetical protein
MKQQTRNLALAIAALIAATAAHAELGGAPTLSDMAPAPRAMAARQQTTGATQLAASAASASYTARQATLPYGTVEREYVGQDGTVFAVAWRGPHRPSLTALLGAGYATQASQMARAAIEKGQGSRTQAGVSNAQLGVRAIARQRFSEGVAWIPSKLPAGVSVDSLELTGSDVPGG